MLSRISVTARRVAILPFWIMVIGCGSMGSLGSFLLSNADAAMGLKDALSQGMFRGFDAVTNNGSSDYAVLKFVMPGEAQDVIRTLNGLGLGPVVNRATEKFNRVIVRSIEVSKPVLINSIRQMTFRDALNILLSGNPHAATDYFKSTNYSLLLQSIAPVVADQVQLEKANVDWDILTAAYNILPGKRNALEKNPSEFVAGRIIDGMCLIMEREEEKIRNTISARSTDAMRKAFGYADTMKKTGNSTLPN